MHARILKLRICNIFCNCCSIVGDQQSLKMVPARGEAAGGKFVRQFHVVFALVLAIQLITKIPCTKGEVFAVGGAAGWTVPRKGMVNYTEWAAMLSSLNVGDTLLFSYPVGEHNVLEVGEEDFDRCRSTSPIATFTDGQTLVNLPREGQYWFICGFTGHCNVGQKFVIDVIDLPPVESPAQAPSSGEPHNPRDLGPAAALAPSALSISPAPTVFGPSSPFLDNSAHHLIHQALFLSTTLLFVIYFVLVIS